MPNDLIIAQRGSDTAPSLSGYTEVTSPLHPARKISEVLQHFGADVYDLSPESHLSKLLKVLLGDVGVGQLQKRMLLTRLQSILGGTHFFDIDTFYSKIFGVNRQAKEQLAVNPFTQDVPLTTWDILRVRDGSYRSRSEQFMKAVGFGATVGGIEQAAEAVLSVDCEVREGWSTEDSVHRSWSDVEALGTYGAIEANFNYLTLENSGTSNPLSGRTRHMITVIPKRVLTDEERYTVTHTLERIKPAGTLLEVIQAPPPVFIPVAVRVAASDSEHWEIRTQVANIPVSGLTLYGA
jgi:hypothetical protein